MKKVGGVNKDGVVAASSFGIDTTALAENIQQGSVQAPGAQRAALGPRYVPLKKVILTVWISNDSWHFYGFFS